MRMPVPGAKNSAAAIATVELSLPVLASPRSWVAVAVDCSVDAFASPAPTVSPA
ncbi:hypothetical protein ACPPVW_04995 [Leifsonia sp. McL0607]|uniref:hypothetical protein n=1 Tax=Leifsonia sp. McL0607 TaxID=3415672 RepID=UPI003CEC73A3